MSSRGESTRILLKSNVYHREEGVSQTIPCMVLIRFWGMFMSHWPYLYVLCCAVWPEVQEWLQSLLWGRPSCPLCCIPSRRCTSPRCPPCRTYWREDNQDVTRPWHQNCMRMGELIICTHKAMRPSEARLNTTLPKAATPVLWPCAREEMVRGSRLPTRPAGERNWGDEQGPKADILRLESIVRNRRAFTLPWGKTKSCRMEVRSWKRDAAERCCHHVVEKWNHFHLDKEGNKHSGTHRNKHEMRHRTS